MALVEEGKLALDTPITQYIPDLKLGGRPAHDDVTLRRLLSMSAGLDFGSRDGFMGDNAIGRYLAKFSDIPLVYPTGQGFGYTNMGPCIAGYAAEKVTGLPWDTLLKKRVFEPAGLTHAATGLRIWLIFTWPSVTRHSKRPARQGFASVAHERKLKSIWRGLSDLHQCAGSGEFR